MFESVVCGMAAILSQPPCVKRSAIVWWIEAQHCFFLGSHCTHNSVCSRQSCICLIHLCHVCGNLSVPSVFTVTPVCKRYRFDFNMHMTGNLGIVLISEKTYHAILQSFQIANFLVICMRTFVIDWSLHRDHPEIAPPSFYAPNL